MRTSHFAIFAITSAILIVASFVIPANSLIPSSVSANPGIMKWDTVNTPGTDAQKNDILNPHIPDGANVPTGSEVYYMAVNGNTMLASVLLDANALVVPPALAPAGNGLGVFYVTTNGGLSWSISRYQSLVRTTGWAAVNAPWNIFHVAIAPDNPNFWAITVGDTVGPVSSLPYMVWVTDDGGTSWYNAGLPALGAAEGIRDISISPSYGGKRDIVVGTGNALATGRLFILQTPGLSSWMLQNNPLAVNMDYLCLRFSPSYAADSSLTMVYADATATYYNIASRDLNQNTNLQWVYPAGIEVKATESGVGSSPDFNTLVFADLELPSDFSGQSASLRRAYISLYAVPKNALNQTGIFRIDDTTVYRLMDTTNIFNKDIWTIAYFGSYASGKLLAGEKWGYPCTATVPTWFTDSPTTCPIPCWYPALKPTTGAANQGTCAGGAHNGEGSAFVAWNQDGSLAYAATSSIPIVTLFTLWPVLIPPPIPNDESAFAISRNNGETWNQLSLIDTTIDWFNDVAVSPDCSTVYLASSNRDNALGCDEFDSVWRSSINPSVAAPLPALAPTGTYWERVLCSTTSGSCALAQSDLPILRIVPSCSDKPDGEIVAWAAQLATATGTTGGVMAWSPDFGDFWATVTPRNPVQDFTFESSTIMYTLSPNGMVQKLDYTGTAWSTSLPSYDSLLTSGGHTIAAYPGGKIMVGPAIGEVYPVSYSPDGGVTFQQMMKAMSPQGNMHVIFDPDFKNNNMRYAGDDNIVRGLGSVFRSSRDFFYDIMSVANGTVGSIWPIPPALPGVDQPPHNIGIFGLAQAWTGDPKPALYAAHDNLTLGTSQGTWDSAVCRAVEPRTGIPKPGVWWDCLDIYSPMNQANVLFTLEPTSLKYCGCCTLDTNTTLYALDDERGVGDGGPFSVAAGVTTRRANSPGNGCWHAGVLGLPGYTPSINQGMLWTYTDCLAKKGPVLKTPADKSLVGADPVTGRNQQIDLFWEQLCLATVYQLDLAKDKDFTLRIITNNPAGAGAIGNSIPTAIALTPGTVRALYQHILIAPPIVTAPATWLAPGLLPEAGAIYYWRVRVAQSATGQWATSQWSETRSFTVKAGFIVNTPYYGVQLLSPHNGCLGCKVRPASISWSPRKEATKDQFDLSKEPEFKQLVVTTTTT
ncbi:MAG: hypothetical protein NT082_05660, partial [Chloroflexi bacterium]|nr:hypothetical protein [Chloroflexota bacterium]